MNVKDVAKRMDKKKVYGWNLSGTGRYELTGFESGKVVYSTAERYDAEIATKKLRGMRMNIVGDIPAEMIR